MESPRSRPTVVIAGATGFVGTVLRHALQRDFRIVALTRSKVPETLPDDEGAEVQWFTCDLFSLLEVEAALQGVDYAIYLVHSMVPSARLVQGTFADLDLILADNFARAAQRCGVKQVIYLGGLVPSRYHLSPHLASRLEVEHALGSGRTPVTALRAGLIVGPGGSSLRIVVNLVRRLPLLILPQWTETPTQPIAIVDVVRAIRLSLGTEACFGRCFDIGGPEVMTYRQMLSRTARILGRRRFSLRLPFFTPGLSKLWVTLFGGASRRLVHPLIDSLRHPMVAFPNPIQAELEKGATGFENALRDSLDARGRLRPAASEPVSSLPRATVRRARLVRSVQRLPLPPGRTAYDVVQEYYAWLPRAVRPFLRSDFRPDGKLSLSLLFRSWKLIEFTFAPYRSADDRQLFYITGGLLARVRGNPKGRIEFREMLDRHCVLVCVHDYAPTLPWFLYRYTQAPFHVWVMRRFGRHLARLARRPSG